MLPTETATTGSAREVFGAFLKLGLTSFGGPIAHIGYLRHEFVHRRAWVDEDQFAQLVAVCQFLPGPASSQLGFSIGLLRAGWLGAIAAFVAFTLPSALLLFVFAAFSPPLHGEMGAAAIHGLKLVAVVVVSHGLVGMASRLTPDLPRALIACGAMALVILTGNAWYQLAAIGAGGILGLWCCRDASAPAASLFAVRYGRRTALAALMVFAVLLTIALGLRPATPPSVGGVAAAFYQAGALVFGGGHVVLPLLQHSVVSPGWVSNDTFLAGYGAAQAVPGPMFTLAAFLGAEIPLGTLPLIGAGVALMAVFLPGFLLVTAVLPVWSRLSQRTWAGRAMAGVNAAVVGLLVAALYDPVWLQGVHSAGDFAIAAVGFALLATQRLPVLCVVAWCVAAAIAMNVLG
jgi:chromate transporter